MVNTTLLILLVIVNYTNFYLTHIHGKRKITSRMKKHFLQ